MVLTRRATARSCRRIRVLLPVATLALVLGLAWRWSGNAALGAVDGPAALPPRLRPLRVRVHTIIPLSAGLLVLFDRFLVVIGRRPQHLVAAALGRLAAPVRLKRLALANRARTRRRRHAVPRR